MGAMARDSLALVARSTKLQSRTIQKYVPSFNFWVSPLTTEIIDRHAASQTRWSAITSQPLISAHPFTKFVRAWNLRKSLSITTADGQQPNGWAISEREHPSSLYDYSPLTRNCYYRSNRLSIQFCAGHQYGTLMPSKSDTPSPSPIRDPSHSFPIS